jgi:AcrR family transcriptional regulator
MEKVDLRVLKTKRVLYEALMSLMQENSFESIKVSDICTKAYVNRSTFYAHYNDKYDLFMDYVNTLKEMLIKELAKINKSVNTKEYYIELIRILFDHIEDNKERYSAILINNRNSIVADILLDVLLKEIQTSSKEDNSDIPNDVSTTFYIGAVLGVGLSWIENKEQYSKEELISYLEKLIPDDIQ